MIFEKYGIHVYPTELKALHRLPNGKILFSLYSMLPGQNFDQFTKVMNSNPKPHIKVFSTIQLFETYAELYYIARRLKHYNVISNYRLDENGNTQIALSQTTQSFRFTGLEQLEGLQVVIPPQIREEIKYRRSQISQNEEKSVSMNNEKSRKQRPNPPSSIAPKPTQAQQNQNVQTTGRPPLSGSNMEPILFNPRSTAPPPMMNNPGPQPNQYQVLQPHPDSRTRAVKRPSPSPTISPGHPVDGTTFQHPPPSNQGQSPQLSYPSYPQSYWSTPPPGEGPPPAIAGLTRGVIQPGTTPQQPELRETSRGFTGLRGAGSGSTQTGAGLTGTSLQSSGLGYYNQRGGHYQVWQR